MANGGYAHPRARTNDPITSQLAAIRVIEIEETHFTIILDTLRECGPMGKDKIAQYADLEPNQVARRMRELQRMGLVELTGETVESFSGRKEREWRITEPTGDDK